MHSSTFEYELQIGEDYFNCEIEAKYTEPKAAITHLAPEDCEPAEDGEFEIECVTVDGLDIRGIIESQTHDKIEKYFWDEIYGSDF